MADRYSFKLVRAREINRVTGLAQLAQRDWRRRGYLPDPGPGKALFDPIQLCQIWVMKLLADRGIGPSLSEGPAGLCAMAIVSRALKSPSAFDVDTADHSTRELEAARQVLLAPSLLQVSGVSKQHAEIIERAPRFFLWLSGDGMVWADRADEALDQVPAERANGPIIILDLHRQATDLLREFGVLASPVVADARQAEVA